MFDLRFFHLVRKILCWEEAPVVHFLNTHESSMQRRPTAPAADDLDPLRMYISIAYPSYFGVKLSIGCFARFRDLVVTA